MRFEGTSDYVATEDLMIAVNAAITLERPLLVKGEPGTGKTELARQVAGSLGLKLVEWHVKSTTRAQQGLYEYDAVSRLRDSQLGDERVRDVKNYIKPGKLWDAFAADDCLDMPDERLISVIRNSRGSDQADESECEKLSHSGTLTQMPVAQSLYKRDANPDGKFPRSEIADNAFALPVAETRRLRAFGTAMFGLALGLGRCGLTACLCFGQGALRRRAQFLFHFTLAGSFRRFRRVRAVTGDGHGGKSLLDRYGRADHLPRSKAHD